jgi:membrane fusion protein, multidrug efflux system
MGKSRIAAVIAMFAIVAVIMYSQRPPRHSAAMAGNREAGISVATNDPAPRETLRRKSRGIDMTATGAIPSGSSVNTAESVSDGTSVRVVVHAKQHVTIGSELNARITQMGFKDGERFKEGEVLISFDCARTDAEIAAARAAYSSHKSVYESNVQMLRYKAVGALAVRQAKFDMEKAAAEVKSLEAKRSACIVVAPFSGRVVETMIQPYEVVAPNQPLIKIVDETKPELDLITPSHWLGWLHAGVAFNVRLDDTGETYRAVVKRIGGAVDPVSQTVRMTAEIDRPNANILSGMSGTATFSRGEKR